MKNSHMTQPNLIRLGLLLGSTLLLAACLPQGEDADTPAPTPQPQPEPQPEPNMPGKAYVTGPGGNEYRHWQYGVDRPALIVSVEERGERQYCRFENDHVLVHDAANQTDPTEGKNQANDLLYPAYEFDCTDTQENTHRKIMTVDEQGQEIVHTYSMLNDTYFYANLTYTLFEQVLQKPPMEKLRLRVHYGGEYDFNLWAYWDGAYVNLSDVFYSAFGSASLDTVSHEIAHGVLQENSALRHASEVEYSKDGRTLHEAYGDMTSVMVTHAFSGELNWEIGEENDASRKRFLDRIETESGAIPSYLDYNQAGLNYYKRMGMMTYPFYLLTQQWGIEDTFAIFTAAATQCWQPNADLIAAAHCVRTQAVAHGKLEQDVIEAFRQVKMKLQAEDTFAHFTADTKKLSVTLNDQTQTDRTIVQYDWHFGDGQQSQLASPVHVYQQAGDYVVTLTVEDDQGVVDAFTRTLSVTDEYCAVREAGAKHEFQQVSIAGESIAFQVDRWDYTDQIITVTAGQPIAINITGDRLEDTKSSVIWYVWVDLNDDGEYTGVDYSDANKSEQRLRLEVTDADLVLDSTFSIPEQYRGHTVFLRASSDAGGFPCYAGVGSSFDVRLHVQ